MNSREIAIFAAKTLAEKKALDITVLDISEKSGFADFFVIASASSLRQLGALCDELDDRLSRESILARHIEGKGDSGWILLDYGDVIVNLFTKEQREHYNIEKIWSDCIPVEFEISEEANA